MNNDKDPQDDGVVKPVTQTKYELLAPDGGWGYVITFAFTITFIVTIVPMAAFGLIYTNFLEELGEATKGTTLANGMFNTCFNFTGLLANYLLQRYSYRKVALVGAAIYCAGSFSILICTNLNQFIASYGIVQGIGFGLLASAVLTTFNSYFDKKLNLMNGIGQSIVVAVQLGAPIVINYLMHEFGYKGTVLIIAGLTLNLFFTAITLQPVEWHMIKKKIDPLELSALVSQYNTGQKDPQQINPLLQSIIEEDVAYIPPKQRASIISLGDRATSVTTINRRDKRGFLENIAKSLDLGLLKSPVYLNISLGISLSYTADVAFIAILPLILSNSGFDETRIAFLMTIYFGADLTARILYSVVSVKYILKNRYVFFVGTALSAIFRIAYVCKDDYHYKMVCLAILGFMRCFIQTPLPVIMAEEYKERFVTAFSLYMVICGVISLIFGPLMSFVKTATQSDIMVVHLLTGAYLWCAVTWILEFTWFKCIKKTK